MERLDTYFKFAARKQPCLAAMYFSSELLYNLLRYERLFKGELNMLSKYTRLCYFASKNKTFLGRYGMGEGAPLP
jgi:hypothetical protein